MIDKALKTLNAMASAKSLLSLALLLGALWIGFAFAGKKLREYSGGIGSIDSHPTYRPEDVDTWIKAYGAAGRRLYLGVELTLDLIFPAAYALFTSLAITLAARSAPKGIVAVRYLALLPFVGMIADYAENLNVITLVTAYPQKIGGLTRVVSVVSSIKWAFDRAAGVLAVISLGWLLLQFMVASIRSNRQT